MALLQVFLALLVLIVTADVFVSVRAKRNMQDICQNGSLTKNISASSFAAWNISEVSVVSNSSECKVEQITPSCLPGFCWEHSNSTDNISMLLLRSTKQGLRCLRFQSEHSIVIIMNQNKSGLIRARQGNICQCSKQGVNQILAPIFCDESETERQATRHIEKIFCSVMLFLLLEVLVCTVLYICVRHKYSQTVTADIENSSGSSSNVELSQIAHQPPVINQEPYQALLLTNRNPRMTAQNGDVLGEPDDTNIALHQGPVQNRSFGGNVFDEDHGKGVTGSNEEPMYTVPEQPVPSEKESSSSRTRQNPLDEIMGIPAHNMAPSTAKPYVGCLYRVVDVPVFTTERSHEELLPRDTYSQSDRALPGNTFEEPFYHVLENPYDTVEGCSLQDVDVDDDETV
ncbi:PREDICTED: uncharacterized protein LOC107340162 isoform X2 [Acropora digitifera]|uniref:uncharacterized protein LOC107340162 isoform X2 n=1 Tax=Acropora digitifera TaxID=70779 RepID=UPI00077A2D77|nr:PREDICTED: uncharacterized protein LOC107340162 isoform X2 [Acropora digitifera]